MQLVQITNRNGNNQVIDEVFAVDGKKVSYNGYLKATKKAFAEHGPAWFKILDVVQYNIHNTPGGALGEARREGYIK